MKQVFWYLVLAILAIAGSIWWYGFADCETIVKASWSLKDVPTRCFDELQHGNN